MIKAVKECMRNWVMAHKKLYWYIVVGLAVLAFGVITAIGCMKLERAEAAETSDGVFYPQLFGDVDLSTYEEAAHDMCNKYPYVLVTKYVNYDTYTYYFFAESSSKLLKAASSWNKATIFDCPARITIKDGVCIEVLDNAVIQVNMRFNGVTVDVELIGTNFAFEYQTDSSHPNYDAVYAELSAKTNNLVHPSDYKEVCTSFFAGGPYLRLKDDFYYNTPYDNSVHDNESFAGVPMLGYCPVASWKWIYKGSIGGYLKDYEGKDTDIISNTKSQITLDVGIPSRAWVSDCMEDLDVSGLRSLRTVAKRNEWVKSRFKNESMEDCIVSFSSNLFVTEDNKDFELTFNYTDMLEHIRESLGIDDWAEYYGVTDVQWDEYWSHIVFGYLTVNQMDSIVFNQYTDTDIMYGGYVSDVFTSGYNYSGYVYQDFFADSQACFDAMKTELQEAYESVIAESEKKLEEYEAELDSINKELEMLRADDTALFDIFCDLADSLKNATGGFRSLSVAVGNVFGFFPPEITACLMFAFLAVLVIAIVKALKG